MSDRELLRFNVRRIDKFKDYTMLVDTVGDCWYVKNNSVLYHRDSRRRDNKEYFHKQCEVKSFYHALGYIKSHSSKYTGIKRSRREQKLEELFNKIKK